LRRGRFYTAADTAETPRVLLINETFERQFFPNEDPLGKRINRGNEREPIWSEIVGVVGDVKYNGLADTVQPAFYEPLAQLGSWNAFLTVKTESANPLGLVGAVRDEIKALDSDLPVSQVGTLEDR